MKKYLIYIGIAIAVIAVAWFVFFKGKTNTATAPLALGKRKNGQPYYQSDVEAKEKEIRGWNKSAAQLKTIQDKATANGVSLDQQWTAEAIWYLTN